VTRSLRTQVAEEVISFCQRRRHFVCAFEVAEPGKACRWSFLRLRRIFFSTCAALAKARLPWRRKTRPDTYFTCMDVQNFLSHRGDPVRLYNGASMNYFFQASPAGGQGVIHVLNYLAAAGSDNALVYLKAPIESARFVSRKSTRRLRSNGLPRRRWGGTVTAAHLGVWRVQMET